VVVGARSTIYIVVLLRMINMGVQVEIFVCKVVWMANKSVKPMIFYDILYCLNVIFLQRVF
jgi:hypothetical protein